MITALLCAQPPTFSGHLITPVAMDTIQHYNHHTSWQLRLYSSYLHSKQDGDSFSARARCFRWLSWGIGIKIKHRRWVGEGFFCYFFLYVQKKNFDANINVHPILIVKYAKKLNICQTVSSWCPGNSFFGSLTWTYCGCTERVVSIEAEKYIAWVVYNPTSSGSVPSVE